jgi:type IV pilus assembly protein PilE
MAVTSIVSKGFRMGARGGRSAGYLDRSGQEDRASNGICWHHGRVATGYPLPRNCRAGTEHATGMVKKMRRMKGFTLIELMVVVVVIAILAAIAYPSYANYVRKAKRADAHDSLLRVQIEQERWRVSNPSYTAEVGPAGLRIAAAAGNCFDSPEGYYEVCLELPVGGVGGPTATSFVAVAEAVDPGQQKDTGCTEIELVVNAANPQGLRTPAQCW